MKVKIQQIDDGGTIYATVPQTKQSSKVITIMLDLLQCTHKIAALPDFIFIDTSTQGSYVHVGLRFQGVCREI